MATTKYQNALPIYRRSRRESVRFGIGGDVSGTRSGGRSFRVSKSASVKKKQKEKIYTGIHTSNYFASAKEEHADNHSTHKQTKLLTKPIDIHTHAATNQHHPQTPTHNNAAYEEEEEEGSTPETPSSNPSPDNEIPSLFELTGQTPIQAPTPDPDTDPHRCTNQIPQPANARNPFYKRPQPGASAIGPHSTIPLLEGGTQIFLLNKWTPFPPLPSASATQRCSHRVGDLIPDPADPTRPVPAIELLPCMAAQLFLAAPFRTVIPACDAMICPPCSRVNKSNYELIKEACALGVCSTCYRRESKRRANLTRAEQESAKSHYCRCMPYPDQDMAICATHIEQYAREVRNRAERCIDYRRQICYSEAAKKKNPYVKRVAPRKRHVGTYWRHIDPPATNLAPWPPSAAHPRNEQGWWDVPRCGCGRQAAHTRKRWPEIRDDKVRSCAICTPVPGDPPLDIANPRPMTVATSAAGYHIGPGVKVPGKTFHAGPHTGQLYGTEGWVRRQ
ncbi:hypothetical protein FKW77_004942 [Venturia effusa]|uniref:Uncharacterized protein n=1 Tax=Venturia effusa TaxID=50376 RepID=A0A517LLF6_9PEZI|nr:hypothetical protein FKW77_004942 [Venturia effusa]